MRSRCDRTSEDSLDQDGTNAAAWLAEFFADEVVEPVRLTVPAHRYLPYLVSSLLDHTAISP